MFVRVLNSPVRCCRCCLHCSKTYQLATQDDFIGRMESYRDQYKTNVQQDKCTFLVPSEEAWENIQRTMGSAYKKLFMGEYSYNVRRMCLSNVLQQRTLIVFLSIILKGSPDPRTPSVSWQGNEHVGSRRAGPRRLFEHDSRQNKVLVRRERWR